MNLGVVSPHVLTRKGLCALLAPMQDFQVTLDVDSAVESFELIKKTRLDILLLDILTPATDLEVVSQLRDSIPEVRVLLLLDGSDEEFQVRAIRTGARGVFPSSRILRSWRGLCAW
jgi:DNA-binding NarL/FixJ family response regulator